MTGQQVVADVPAPQKMEPQIPEVDARLTAPSLDWETQEDAGGAGQRYQPRFAECGTGSE
jgi:hypothetical protein